MHYVMLLKSSYNNQTVLQHVLAVAITIVGELHELRHLYCKDCLSYYYAYAVGCSLRHLSPYNMVGTDLQYCIIWQLSL
jgi:hypothetical protein